MGILNLTLYNKLIVQNRVVDPSNGQMKRALAITFTYPAATPQPTIRMCLFFYIKIIEKTVCVFFAESGSEFLIKKLSFWLQTTLSETNV